METLSDLYRNNPEPSGFRIRKAGGRVLPEVYPTYEQAEKAAEGQGFGTGWRALPVYGEPNLEASILGEKTTWAWDGSSDTIFVG